MAYLISPWICVEARRPEASRSERKNLATITRRDRIKVTFSDIKLDEFVTDAEIATADEAIQKAKHLLDTALVY
jgi:hypothetical protein